MNGYNFTERIRAVLAMAREESVRLRHEYVGTEHQLLALIREGSGVAAAVLERLDIDRERLRATVESAVMMGPTALPANQSLPYTSRAKKVLELAMAQANDFRHDHIDTEHLLLGLIREERGVAAQVLVHAGATREKVTAEILRLLGTESTPVEPRTPGRVARAESRAVITISVRGPDGSLVHGEFNGLADAIIFLATATKGQPQDPQ